MTLAALPLNLDLFDLSGPDLLRNTTKQAQWWQIPSTYVDDQPQYRNESTRTERKSLDPYTPFFIPEGLLRNKKVDPQSQSLVLQLPSEVLLLVIEQISIPHFQVAFGLTCKSIASLILSNRNSLSPWRGFRDKEGLYRLLTKQPKPSNILDVADTTPFRDSRSLSSGDILVTTQPNPYIPSQFRLCRACFRFVPRDPQYWFSKLAELARNARRYSEPPLQQGIGTLDPCVLEPRIRLHDIQTFFVSNDRNDGQHRCPECVVKGNLRFMSEREFVKALAEDEWDEDQMWSGDFGGGIHPRGPRVRRGLRERMQRP